MKGVGDDGGSSEEDGGFVGVDFDEAGQRTRTGGEKIVPEDTVGGRLPDGCFEGWNSLFSESCRLGASEDGGGA